MGKVKEIDDLYPGDEWVEDKEPTNKNVIAIRDLLKDLSDEEKADVILHYIGGKGMDVVAQRVNTRFCLELADYCARVNETTLEEGFYMMAQTFYERFAEWCDVPDWVHDTYEDGVNNG